MIRRLADADVASVRDAVTQANVRAAGVQASLVPDPVAAVERLFGPRIRERARVRPVAGILRDFADGYLALQLSAEFGDDASLARAADQLARLCTRTKLGLVLWRAGAAPWHDDAGLLARLAARLPDGRARIFESLDVWDLCALLAHARACACSSLHGAIVSSAFGVPAVGLVREGDHGQSAKLVAYLETWHAPDETRAWPLDRLAEGVEAAMGLEEARRRESADRRAQACITFFERLSAVLD